MKNSFSKKEAILFGWEKFKENALLLIGVFIVLGIVAFVFDAADKLKLVALSMFAIGVVGIIVQIVLEMGVTRISLNIHDKREVSFANLIGETPKFLYFILAQILSLIIIAIATVFLIIPGIIAAVGLFFVPYIVIDKQLGPIEAVKDSWRLTKGHKWNIFWFGVLLVIMNLLGAAAFGVGLLITLPTSFLATVYVYKWLDRQDTPVVQSENG